MDFNDVLTDFELAMDFTLARITLTVDDTGKAVRSVAERTLSGVILPATDRQLERMPEGDRGSEVVAVYAQELLTAGTSLLAPDEITRNGRTYRVRQVQDWMATAGYCMALAVSVDLQAEEALA